MSPLRGYDGIAHVSSTYGATRRARPDSRMFDRLVRWAVKDLTTSNRDAILFNDEQLVEVIKAIGDLEVQVKRHTEDGYIQVKRRFPL